MEEGRSAFKTLTGKPTRKRPLGRPRCRWEDNIRMVIKEIGIIRGIGLISLRINVLEFPFNFLCYYIFKNYYRSVCVSKWHLNY